MKPLIPFLLLITLLIPKKAFSCSVLYYVHPETGKIYVVNNEDYWYDVEAYIKIEPATKKKLARLWYGWDNFAQGGINAAGLFFDAAVTPEMDRIEGTKHPKNNLGDALLAHCRTVEEALDYLEKEKIALTNSHMMFGDRSGKAVIVEWVEGQRVLHWMEGHQLIMTNYLLSDPEAGNYPCPRYASIEKQLEAMESTGEEINLLRVGNAVGQAVQPPREIESGRVGGTLYTSFMDITDNKFYLSYKLSNQNILKLDLKEEFSDPDGRKITLGE